MHMLSSVNLEEFTFYLKCDYLNYYDILSITLKPIFHWKLGLRWPPNANEIEKKKKEMYIANATNIPLTCVGGWRRG